MIKDYKEQGPLPKKARLDFRLSPPATFTVSRTLQQQNFSEAPWNLRRLLGYPGQRAPGMPVFSLQFELMYGLNATITTPNLMLAEPRPGWGDCLPAGRPPGSNSRGNRPGVRRSST